MGCSDHPAAVLLAEPLTSTDDGVVGVAFETRAVPNSIPDEALVLTSPPAKEPKRS